MPFYAVLLGLRLANLSHDDILGTIMLEDVLPIGYSWGTDLLISLRAGRGSSR